MIVSGPPPNQLLQLLDAADFDLLRPHLATVEMVSKSVVGEVGIAPRHVYFPHAGSVSIRVSLSEGQTIEIALLGRDSVVGTGAALADGISPMDAVVLFPGVASALEIGVFRAIAASSTRFRKLMVRHEQVMLAHAQQSLLCNTSHPVEARLARWLLRAHDLSDGPILPLTQEALAQMIGVRRNAISLVAHALQRAGIIRYSRGQIEIVDPHALLTTSCGCYSAVKAHHLRLMGAVA
ncbi:Crp/Fnr family transcriptional regulator [Bradyrhizobium sp. DOA9]|uniref:Crp/Fnr family transcriptional regulator n=1 Tax=Bradyrhizobium sp. DOA9 TaxID=1126627 RepID=UPI000469C156|nr:Crp/Fnr family transcriptional regulator [Bradyrhizobium sp. DOA9]